MSGQNRSSLHAQPPVISPSSFDRAPRVITGLRPPSHDPRHAAGANPNLQGGARPNRNRHFRYLSAAREARAPRTVSTRTRPRSPQPPRPLIDVLRRSALTGTRGHSPPSLDPAPKPGTTTGLGATGCPTPTI